MHQNKEKNTKVPKKVKIKDNILFEDAQTLEYKNLFKAMDHNNSGTIDKQQIFDLIKLTGIKLNDSRINKPLTFLKKLNKEKLDIDDFSSLFGESSSFLRNILKRNLIIPNFKQFTETISEIYQQVNENTDGAVADYIPQLARINPDQFAVALTTISGQRFSQGDDSVPFCLQSAIKPLNYCMALEEFGSAKVHQHIGREPSGKGFNEMGLNDKGLPHNPMINSGAIMCSSLIKSQLNLADRFDYILQVLKRLSGNSNVNFNNTVFLSEKENADRNFALGYFMREKKAFPPQTNLPQTLDFYFQSCSVEMDVKGLSIVAATLANGGVCPITGEKIFSSLTVQHCLSLMCSCGMYDFSGEFAFTIGLPAKSGISGAIMVVVPNVLGLAIWSPRLDSQGNSVRGIQFCEMLVQKFNFHAYDNISMCTSDSFKKDPRLDKNSLQIESVVKLCWAAGQGDISEVQNLISKGADPNYCDYDGRTPLHLAASEGHPRVVELLLSHNVNHSPIDRWEGTPLTDATRKKHREIISILKKWGAQ